MVSGIGNPPIGKSVIFGRIENVCPDCRDSFVIRQAMQASTAKGAAWGISAGPGDPRVGILTDARGEHPPDGHRDLGRGS